MLVVDTKPPTDWPFWGLLCHVSYPKKKDKMYSHAIAKKFFNFHIVYNISLTNDHKSSNGGKFDNPGFGSKFACHLDGNFQGNRSKAFAFFQQGSRHNLGWTRILNAT